MPTTVPVDTVPAGFVRVNDDTRRIRIVVPDNWTDTETFPAMTDDGRDRPKIIASPDIAAMFETWTTPGVWFGAVPPPADPAAWLAAFTFESACIARRHGAVRQRTRHGREGVVDQLRRRHRRSHPRRRAVC